MAGNLGSLAVYLTADKSNLDKNFTSAMGTVKRFAGTLAGLAGVSSLGVLAKQSYDAFTEAETNEKRIASVLNATRHAAGLTSQELYNHASALQYMTGVEDDVVMSGQAILATFKNIRGDQFKEATGIMLDMAAVMGTDAKSGAIQLGKALNDPIRGVTSLRRVGVSFNQQQLAQIKTMQESGNLMGAQKIILAELRSEFGGTAEALNTPTKQLTANLGDVKEGIGAVITEILGLRDMDQFSGVNDSLSKWASDLRENAFEIGFAFRSVFIDIKAGFSEFAEYTRPIWENISNAVSNVADNIGTLFGWIVDNAGKVWDNIWNLSVAVLKDLGTMFADFGKNIFKTITLQDTDWTGMFADIGKNFEREMAKSGISELKLTPMEIVGYGDLDKNLNKIQREQEDAQNRLGKNAQARRDKEAAARRKEADEARKAKNSPYDSEGSQKAVQQKVQVSLVRGTMEAVKAEAQTRLDAQNIEISRQIVKNTERTAKATEDLLKNNNSGGTTQTIEIEEAI